MNSAAEILNPIQPFQDLKMLNSDLPRVRIRDHVKSLIVSGRLQPDGELPSTRKLAALWGVDAAIVHAALSDLVKERLLIRRHGKGTFVADRVKRLHRVGLYARLNSLSDPSKWFVRRVIEEIQKQLAQGGIDGHAWLDPRPENDRTSAWRELESSARQKEMQGLILVDCDVPTLKWAQALSLPLAAITPLDVPFAVKGDGHQLFELGLRRLAGQGCRTVGLITVHPVIEAYQNYFEEMVETSAAFGLKMKNSWIRIPDGPDGVTSEGFSRFGYRQFHAIWDQTDRPDGLIIEPDNVVEGAMPAILQRNVKVPEQLKLILHRNLAHDYICPFATTQIVTNESLYASALISQIERQVADKPCSPIQVPYELIERPGERLG